MYTHGQNIEAVAKAQGWTFEAKAIKFGLEAKA